MDEQQSHLILAQIFRLPFWLRISILLPILTFGVVLKKLGQIIPWIRLFFVELWLFSKTGIDNATGFNYITGKFEDEEKFEDKEEILTYKGIPVANLNAKNEDSFIGFNDKI